MPLTPDDERRIREEEALRVKVRREEDGKKAMQGCLVAVLLAAFLMTAPVVCVRYSQWRSGSGMRSAASPIAESPSLPGVCSSGSIKSVRTLMDHAETADEIRSARNAVDDLLKREECSRDQELAAIASVLANRWTALTAPTVSPAPGEESSDDGGMRRSGTNDRPDRLAPVSQPESLPESRRRQIYWDMVAAQDVVQGRGADAERAAGQRVAESYGITEQQRKAIVIEGATNRWPMPPPPPQ